MEKIVKVLRNTLYYILIIIISSFTYSHIPIGAIAVFCASFASLNILAPVILLSIASLVFFDMPSILVYLIFISIFIFETIYIKPLIAIENRGEKKKVNNYLVITLTSILLIYLHAYSIVIALLTLALYKICVNGLVVIKNSNNMLSFAKEEHISVIVLLTLVLAYIFTLMLSFGMNIYILFAIIALIFISNIYYLFKADKLLIVFMFLNSVLGIKYMFNSLNLNTKTLYSIVLILALILICNQIFKNLKQISKYYIHILLTLIYVCIYSYIRCSVLNINNVLVLSSVFLVYIYNIYLILKSYTTKISKNDTYLLTSYTDNRIKNSKGEKFNLIQINNNMLVEEFNKEIEIDITLKNMIKNTYTDIITADNPIAELIEFLNKFTLDYFEIENILNLEEILQLKSDKISSDLGIKTLKYLIINNIVIQYFNILEKQLKKQEKNDKITKEVISEIIDKREINNLLYLKTIKTINKYILDINNVDEIEIDEYKKLTKINIDKLEKFIDEYIKNNETKEKITNEITKEENNIYYSLGEKNSFEEIILTNEEFKNVSIYNQLIYSNKTLFNIYTLFLKKKNISFHNLQEVDINMSKEDVTEFRELTIYEICDILGEQNIIVDIKDKEIIDDVKKINKVFLEYLTNISNSVKLQAKLNLMIKLIIYNIVLIIKKQEKVFEESIKEKVKIENTKENHQSIHELIKKLKK